MRARARPGRQRDSTTDDALVAAPVVLPNRLINLAAAGNAAVQRALAPADAFALATSGPAGPVPYRAELEREFGRGFGHMRAHLGGPAAREGLAELGAVAAAYGSSVAFATEQPSRAASEKTRFIRSIAQNRFTAVGRVAAMR